MPDRRPSDEPRKTPYHGQLRDRARRAVYDPGPPTTPISPVRQPSGLTAEVERSVLDLVLRMGEALTATGAPAADATAALYRLAAGFGVTTCQIDITFSSITVSIDRDDDPITKVRVIAVRTSDYSRLAKLLQLCDDAGKGRVDLATARQTLDDYIAAPHPYRRWVVTGALAAMAAGVAVLLGGGPLGALIAATTTAVIDRTLRFLRYRGLPYLFQQAVGAGIATIVALLIFWARNEFDWSAATLSTSVIVASSIVVLLAGLSLVGAADDAISGFTLIAAARGFEVLLFTLGIVVGIGFVLNVGRRLEIPLHIAATSVSESLIVQVLAGAAIAGAWGIASYAGARSVALALPAGAIAAVSYVIFSDLEIGTGTAAFGAAIIVGFFAGTVGSYANASPLVVSICGVTPLLPGLAIYAAMFSLVESDNILDGAGGMIGAIGIGLALAAGVTLGEILARPFQPEGDLWQRRVRRRARGSRI